MGQRVLAVLAGFVLWSIMWVAANSLLSILFASLFNPDGSTDSNGMLAIFLLSSIVFSILSGALTGRIGKASPVGNAVVLGLLLLAVGIFVQLQFWEHMPLWYHLGFLVALLPAAVYGGKMAAGPARRD